MGQSVRQKPINNRQALALLFTANGISGFAQGLTMLSVPWYFAQQSMSSQFNLMYGIVTFLTIFWGLWAGTVVDRFNRKLVFLLNNAVEGFIVLAVAFYGLSQSGMLPVPLIMLVFTITIFGFYLHYPNLYAFAQEITKEGNYTKVNSYIEIVGQSTNVMAGALAALLLEGISWQGEWALLGQDFVINIQFEAWSLTEVFLLDGVTYIISIALISKIRYQSVKTREIDKGALANRLKVGFNFLKAHPMILIFGVCSHSVFVAMLVKLHAMMPLYITNHLREGGDIFGAMEVLYGLGALSAGLFVGNLFVKFTTVSSVIVLLLLATAALGLSALTNSVGAFLIVGLMIGFANAGTRVLRLSYLFKHIPNSVIGRVNSIFSIINVAMRVFFLAIFSAQFFGQGSNIVFAYGIMATFTAISAAVLAMNYRRIICV